MAKKVTRKKPERHPKAKPLRIEEIKKLRKKYSVSKIAAAHNVTRQAVYQQLWRNR
jgi:DNA-binding transcriptional regulator YiaG